MRKALIIVLVLAAVGGAYFVGTLSKPAAPAVAAPTPPPTAIVDNLIVPTGLTIPEKLPAMKIDDPAKVLAGEVKVPVDLLRKDPPANPNFVVPDLSK
ncbi:MAG: hypothetical protein KF873_11155 [Gemmataceae bacterium]|nr:hypothetical protein [Gemmataceae bacterium]